jgi:diguanylate cyclase (GGDEF)-like protein
MCSRVASEPFLFNEVRVWVTVSLGVACCSGDTDASIDHMIEAADQALFSAKRAGRNQVMAVKAGETYPDSKSLI